MIACVVPTFVSRYVIYGNPFESGYVSLKDWAWRSPYFLAVLFSSEHGLFAWTPVIALAFIGVVMLALREPRAGGAILAAMLAFYFFIACYPDWAGISSYGNRFFVSLSSDLRHWLERFLRSRRAILRVAANRDDDTRHSGGVARRLEPGVHLSMGNASRSGARADRLGRNDSQPIRGRPARNRDESARIFVPSVEPDAADRTARHRAIAWQIAHYAASRCGTPTDSRRG